MTIIEGLNVDTQKIGEGLYKIICARGEEALVAFGMLPKDLINMLEAQTLDRVVKITADGLGVTDQEARLLELRQNDRVIETVREIVKDVCPQIYAAAARKRMMLV